MAIVVQSREGMPPSAMLHTSSDIARAMRYRSESCCNVYLVLIMFHQYIQRVIADRRVMYEDEDPEISLMDINSTQNGIFLRKDLHSQFGRGGSQFLKVRETIILATASVPQYNAAVCSRLPTLP
jgi:hypothetical protein